MDKDDNLIRKADSIDKRKDVYHGNIPPSLILPYPCGTIGPGESTFLFGDCREGGLKSLSQHFKVEHLSECTNSKLLEYPVAGLADDIGYRFVVPLKVRANPKATEYIVYFIVDSGAPITSFGETTAKKLFGERQFGSVIIQGVHTYCRRSGECNDSLKDVNLLGSRFLLQSNMSVIVSPNTWEYLSEKRKVFYLAPFSMISEAQKMAEASEQSVDVTKRLKTLSRSNPTDNSEKKIEKDEEDRPIGSATSESDTQIPSHHASTMSLDQS